MVFIVRIRISHFRTQVSDTAVPRLHGESLKALKSEFHAATVMLHALVPVVDLVSCAEFALLRKWAADGPIGNGTGG